MAEYIERTALLFAMDDYFHMTAPDGDEQIGVLRMRRLVRTFAPADVAPVVHGRWVFDTVNGRECMKCSECLKSQTPTGVFTYCPNCGARMDGE